MVTKPSASPDIETDDEVFTDLHGVPDPVPTGDEPEAGALSTPMVEQPADTSKPLDEDLEIVDEPAADEPLEPVDEPAPAAAAEPTPEPEPEVVEYDPRDAQMLAFRAQNLELRKSHATSAKSAGAAEIERAKKAIKAAKEAGDSDAEIDAMDAYANARQAVANADSDLTSIAGEENGMRSEYAALAAKAPKDADGKPIWTQRVTKKAAAATPAAQPSKLVPKFLKANPWYSDPKTAAQAGVLRALDSALDAEKKLNKDDPAYWAELGARFNRQYPGLYKSLDGKPIATGERRRGAGASAGGIPSASGGGSGTRVATPTDPKSIRLTSDDLTQMSKFGMEDTPANRRVWLTEKRATFAQGAN